MSQGVYASVALGFSTLRHVAEVQRRLAPSEHLWPSPARTGALSLRRGCGNLGSRLERCRKDEKRKSHRGRARPLLWSTTAG